MHQVLVDLKAVATRENSSNTTGSKNASALNHAATRRSGGHLDELSALKCFREFELINRI